MEEPTSAISPANSIPGISAGNPGGGGYLPCRCNRSARLSEEARTRTRTCSSLISGLPTVRISSTSGPPKVEIQTACMVFISGRVIIKTRGGAVAEKGGKLLGLLAGCEANGETKIEFIERTPLKRHRRG